MTKNVRKEYLYRLKIIPHNVFLSTKGKIVGKPGRHHLMQVIRINITSNGTK